MTCCIGALCEENDSNPSQAVVVASDRMVTLGGFIEFEHAIPKIQRLNSNAVILSAGDALNASKVITELKKKLPATALTIEHIAKEASEIYALSRDKTIETTFFRPRGLTRQLFYTQLQLNMQPQLAFQLDQQVTTYNLGVELIIAGIDDTGAYLYGVVNPGSDFTDFHLIGYHSVGSGSIHAMQTMIAFGHTPTKSLELTVFSVYFAKKRGEVAPGVGKDTDIMIINKKGIYKLSDIELEELDTVYQEYKKPMEENKLLGKISEISLFKDKKYE